MAPIPYNVSYSFAGYQAYNPSTPLPAPRVDTEFANIATSIASLITGLGLIQRGDGKLANGSVSLNTLGQDVLNILYRLPPPLTSVAQLKKALALTNNVAVAADGISADPNDAANIIWNSGGATAYGDALSTTIQLALGYTNAQMSALYGLALLQAP